MVLTENILIELERRFPGKHPRIVTVREYLAGACAEFVACGLADPKFVRELLSGSDQKFWACVSEALVAARLNGKTFCQRTSLGKGPDFLIMEGNHRVWIEVVCPEPVNVPQDWIDPQPETVINFPHKEILLRWTSAIKSKAEALVGSADGKCQGYLKSGVVGLDDAYVIAVNGCRLRSGPFAGLFGISQFPFAAEAVFPIGPYQLCINTETSEIIDRGYQHRPYLINKNGAKVPAYMFLDPRFSRISAIWALDLNGGVAIGNSEPAVVIHNPFAAIKVPVGFLPADDEYIGFLKDEEIIVTKESLRSAGDG
jgi:type I restriction enzyme S subunit